MAEALEFCGLPIASLWVGPLDPMFGPVSIERTGRRHDDDLTVDCWAIRHSGKCFGRDGEWEFEPLPSSRTDEWLAAHRFALDEAIPIAEEAVTSLYGAYGREVPGAPTQQEPS